MFEIYTQRLGADIHYPAANLLSKAVKKIFLISNDYICYRIFRRLEKGKQPKLRTLSSKYDGCWNRGAKVVPLTLENLDTLTKIEKLYSKEYEHVNFYGCMVSYKYLCDYLKQKGWKPICFSQELLDLYEIDLFWYGFGNTKPYHIIFVPICRKWP